MIRWPFRRRFWFSSVGVGLAVCGTLGWIGSETFLVPRRRALEPRHLEALRTPAEFGLKLEGAFTALGADGTELDCLLISPADGLGKAEKTRRMIARLGGPSDGSPGTVVMHHGRGGIKEDAFPVAERFVAAGFRCLIFDARAHGTSGGEFTTFGAKEVGDLRAVIEAAEERFGEETLGPLVGFGISLGAAVMVQALPEEPRLQAAVVVCPFAELSEVIHRAVGNVIDPRIPPILTGLVMETGGLRGGFSPGSIRPVRNAEEASVPVMVVHAENDRVIPLESGRKVFEALPKSTGPHQWCLVEDAGHGNVLAVGGDDLYQEMIEFWLGALNGGGNEFTSRARALLDPLDPGGDAFVDHGLVVTAGFHGLDSHVGIGGAELGDEWLGLFRTDEGIVFGEEEEHGCGERVGVVQR